MSSHVKQTRISRCSKNLNFIDWLKVKSFRFALSFGVETCEDLAKREFA